MEILFVTSEIAPYSKVGGLGDVCSALPKALRGLGHNVTVLSPLYSDIDPMAKSLARRLIKIEVQLNGRSYNCELYDGRTTAGVELLFLGQEELFRKVPYVYGGGEAYEFDAIRFSALSQAAVQLMRAREPRFDILHAHDWQTSLAIMLAKRDATLAATPSVLTVHNLAHQGTFPKAMVDTLNMSWDLFTADGLEYYDKMSLLKGGLLFADRITTVSPTYAKEILTPEGSHGMDGVLRTRADKLHGILNGVDTAIWNSATDAIIPARYDAMDLIGKAKCKHELQRQLGLPMRADLPLVGAVGRLAFQKGYDLLAKTGPQLLRNDVQLVVLGDGDIETREAFAELAHRWPDRVHFHAGHDEALAHRIFAGSDLFVVPSRFEPCGLTQMYAHRYGSVPIVRNTGGLADTVIDCDAKLESGTGFVFDEPTPRALLAAIQRGISAFTLGAPFESLQKRVMRIDHTWERSARLYESLYKEILPK